MKKACARTPGEVSRIAFVIYRPRIIVLYLFVCSVFERERMQRDLLGLERIRGRFVVRDRETKSQAHRQGFGEGFDQNNVQHVAGNRKPALGRAQYGSAHSRVRGQNIGQSDFPDHRCVAHARYDGLVDNAPGTVSRARSYLSAYCLGLDPAKPLYENSGPEDRLDVNDALFVDVMHTNGGRNGILKSLGHIDYFPNGGKKQPNCGKSDKGTTSWKNMRFEMFSRSDVL